MSKLGHYDNHPGYVYQALVVFSDLKFGRDNENPPNIEAEYGRGGPWFTGGLPISLVDEGCNPTGAIFEPLTDDVFGAGFAEADLFQPSFDSLRADLNTALNTIRISVDQGDQTDMRSYLAAVLEYFDGFLVRRGTQIAIGRWLQGNINTAILPIIGSTDLYSEPRLKSNGWDDCITEVNVQFRDRAAFFHDANASVRNPALQQSLNEYRPVNLQRPFLIDATMANTYATQYLQRFARPGYTGEIDVKLERVEAIEDAAGMPIAGLLVKTDSASLGEELVFRVIECEYPGEEGPFYCTLTVELERSIWPLPFTQPPPKRIGNFIVDVPNIVNHHIEELPSGLKDSSAIEVAILAQRPGKSIVGFHVHVSTDNVTFIPSGTPCVFGPYGILHQAYPNTTATDDLLGFQVELFGVDLLPTLTRQDKLNYRLLAVIGTEIMSIGAWFALGAGIYQVPTLRALYGTTKATHPITEQVFFILNSALVPIANKNFVLGQKVFFKLQPFDSRQDFDLAGVTSFPYIIGGGAVAVPTSIILTSDFVITSERKVDSRITASWSYVHDQDISGFNVRTRKVTFDSTWVTLTADLSATQTFKGLEPNVLYEVQVQAVNSNGEPSLWSPISTITTAAPDVSGAPTGFGVTPGVASVRLAWKNAAGSDAQRGTQILFSLVLGDDTHLNVIDEVPINETSYTHTAVDLTSFLFYAVRHINTLGVPGTRTASLATLSLTDAPTIRVSTPLIGEGATGSGTIGTANFRVLIVDQQGAAGPADLFFSINDGTFAAYSRTANYKTTTTGTVLPTNNNGEISCGVGDKIVAYAVQFGFLQSAFSQPFYNNATNSPDRVGTGGGTPIARLP